MTLARISKYRALRWFAAGYVEVLQGTPLLMQLFLWFFMLFLAAITSSVITCALFMGTPRARYPFDVIFLLCGAAQVSRLFRRRVPTGSDSARRGG